MRNHYPDTLLVLPGVRSLLRTGHLLVYGNPSIPERIGILLAKIDLIGPKGGRDSPYGALHGGRDP